MAFALQLRDEVRLRARPDLRPHVVDPELARDRLRGAPRIAGDEERAQAHALDFGEGLLRGRFHDVRDREDRTGLAVDRPHEDRLSRGLMVRHHPVAQFREAVRAREVRRADPDVPAVDPGVHALARQRLERLRLRDREAALARRLHDGRRERVLRAELRAGEEPQHLVLPDPGAREVVGDPRAPDGQRAGLVERHDVDGLRRLECVCALHEDAARRAAARAHDDRGRRREPERARAGDDEHRDERRQRVAERRVRPERQPGQRARERDDEHDRHEHRRDAVDEPLDGGLRALRLLDHAHDLREERVGADPRHTEPEGAAAIQRPARDVVAGALLDRQRLARHHRLVDPRRSRDDESVGRDGLARPDDHDVSDYQLFDRHVLFRTAPPTHARALRAERGERADRIRGVGARASLQVPSHEDERDDRGRGVVVEVLPRLEPERVEEPGEEGRGDRNEVRRRRAEDHERVHVGASMTRRRQRAAVERERGPELHGRREGEEDVRAPRRLHERGKREIGHGERHRRHGERRRDGESPSERADVRAPRGALLLLGRRALALVLRDRERAVARALDRADERRDVGASGIDLDARALRRQIHVGGADARHAAERVLDARDARRAGHAGDDEIASRHGDGAVALARFGGYRHALTPAGSRLPSGPCAPRGRRRCRGRVPSSR